MKTLQRTRISRQRIEEETKKSPQAEGRRRKAVVVTAALECVMMFDSSGKTSQPASDSAAQ
jgi:hypothetical protein